MRRLGMGGGLSLARRDVEIEDLCKEIDEKVIISTRILCDDQAKIRAGSTVCMVFKVAI